jgi:hypothetical protein
MGHFVTKERKDPSTVFKEAHKTKREVIDRKIREQLDRIITHGNCHTNQQL